MKKKFGYIIAGALCASVLALWIFSHAKSGDSLSNSPQAGEEEDIIPSDLTSELFPVGTLTKLCQDSPTTQSSAGLFSHDSTFVWIGKNEKNEECYRFRGQVLSKSHATFDFLGNGSDLESLCKEAQFLADVDNLVWYQAPGNFAHSVAGGAVDWGHEFADLSLQVKAFIKQAASNSWSLATDGAYRKQIIADMAAWSKKIGYEISSVSLNDIYTQIKAIDFENIKVAISGVAKAYWENEREKEALDHGFSTATIRLGSPTWNYLDNRTSARIAGHMAPDVALITLGATFAPKGVGTAEKASQLLAHAVEIEKEASESNKIGAVSRRLADPRKLREMGALFPEGVELANKIVTSEESIGAISPVQHVRSIAAIKSLLDPEKLATLKGLRATNRRLKLAMFHLNEIEKMGLQGSEVLDNVYAEAKVGANTIPDSIAQYEKRNLEANFRLSKDWGLFDSEENLEALRKGNAAKILRGAHAGQMIDVDHLIPVKFAPELANSPGNLFISPSSLNRARGASLDETARRAIRKLEEVSDWRPSPELVKAMAH